MHSVGEIDIQVPWLAEHHFVAFGFASVPVAGDVVRSAVCFYFHDAPGSDTAVAMPIRDFLRFATVCWVAKIRRAALINTDNHLIEQLQRQLYRVATVERPRQSFARLQPKLARPLNVRRLQISDQIETLVSQSPIFQRQVVRLTTCGLRFRSCCSNSPLSPPRQNGRIGISRWLASTRTDLALLQVRCISQKRCRQ